MHNIYSPLYDLYYVPYIFLYMHYIYFLFNDLPLQAADIQPTLRVLIDAVTRTFPMARYTPVTATEKLQIFLAEHLPPSLYESLYGEQKKFVY